MVHVQFKNSILECKREIKVVQEAESLEDISYAQSFSSNLQGQRGLMGLNELDLVNYVPNQLGLGRKDSFYFGSEKAVNTTNQQESFKADASMLF